MDRPPEPPAGQMPPEPRDDRRTIVSAEERRLLAGQGPPDERGTSEGRQRLLRERRRQESPVAAWRRWGWVYLLVAGAGLLLLVLWLLRTQVPESFAPMGDGGGPHQRFALEATALTFASPDGRRLQTETQLLRSLPASEERMRGVIAALIEGPTTGLLNPWPRAAELLDLYLAEDGTAYVNMNGSVRARLDPGDAIEWLLVASLTCTLCDNFPAVRGVRLLVDGESQGFLRRLMPLEWTYSPGMFTEVR